MDVGQYSRKVLDSPDALGTARSEDLGQWVYSGRSDADVVHRDAGIVGLLDRVCRVGPGIASLVALIGDQAVTDHDEQAALGLFASVRPLTILPTSLRGQGRAGPVRYEVYGAGPTLIIGSPITLSSAEAIRTGYLDRLTDRYRVILMHYPSGDEEATSFTPDPRFR